MFQISLFDFCHTFQRVADNLSYCYKRFWALFANYKSKLKKKEGEGSGEVAGKGRGECED
jgi:hypothetical protein